MLALSCYNGEFRGSLILVVLLNISKRFSTGENLFLDLVNWPFWLVLTALGILFKKRNNLQMPPFLLFHNRFAFVLSIFWLVLQEVDKSWRQGEFWNHVRWKNLHDFNSTPVLKRTHCRQFVDLQMVYDWISLIQDDSHAASTIRENG